MSAHTWLPKVISGKSHKVSFGNVCAYTISESDIWKMINIGDFFRGGYKMIHKRLHSLLLAAALFSAAALPAYASPIDLADKNIITVIQTKLNESGFDCGTPDGVAGAKTKQAVKDYRAANGLAEGEAIDYELFNALTLNEDEYKFVEEVSTVCEQTIPAAMTLQGITLYNYDLCISIDPGAAANEGAAETEPAAGTEITAPEIETEATEPDASTGTDESAAGTDSAESAASTGTDESTAETDSAEPAASTGTDEPEADTETAAPAEFSPTSTAVLTDAILKLEDGADLWDTITISFTGLGEVVRGREDLEFAEGVSPEVKEFLGSYEAFVNEYSEFLETYDQNNFTLQTQYLKYLHKYSEIADQAAELGASDMSETDKAYFDAVMARSAKRLGDYAIIK